MSGGRRAALCLGLAALAGCRSVQGIPDEELPAHPIAIHYRTPEEARRRVDAIESAQRKALREEPPAGETTVVGSKARLRADVGELGDFLAHAFGTDPPPEMPRGRLALLDPRTRSLELVPGALRGSVPLAWSRDRRRLLFAQPDPDRPDVQIFEWNLAAQTVRQVTHGPPIHSQACYASGGRIVVAATQPGEDAPASRIRVSQRSGGGPFVDLSPGPDDHTPTCASDGRSVAFARSDPRRGSEIWLVSLDAEHEPRWLARGHHPRFAAGGAWIVYTAASRGAARIFRVRTDGSGRAPIGRGARDEAWPSLSPDGKLVAYIASEKPPRRHVYVRRFDGSGDRILFADGDGEFPVW